MKRKWLVFLCIIIFLGGCNLLKKDIADMDPKDLPDVTAFQDEFTREFMASTKEVSDGYYLFESKTGGYTIPFPEDARMDKIYYEKTKDNFEWVKYDGDHEKVTDASYTIYAKYGNPSIPDDPDMLLKHFESSIKYEGEFEKSEYTDTTHYFAQSKYVLSDNQASVYRFFGLVQSRETNQYVRYEYHVRCPDEQNGCNYDLEAIEHEVKDLMKSIEFKIDEGGITNDR